MSRGKWAPNTQALPFCETVARSRAGETPSRVARAQLDPRHRSLKTTLTLPPVHKSAKHVAGVGKRRILERGRLNRIRSGHEAWIFEGYRSKWLSSPRRRQNPPQRPSNHALDVVFFPGVFKLVVCCVVKHAPIGSTCAGDSDFASSLHAIWIGIPRGSGLLAVPDPF